MKGDLIHADPTRAASYESIIESVRQLTRLDSYSLLNPLVYRFANWVADLPASESNHHSRPFGLLDHSLDTARILLIEWDRHLPTLDRIADPDPELRDAWLLAATVVGLFHDCGKVFDIDVIAPTGVIWEPESEPLTSFRLREGGYPLAPMSFRFRRGRGWDLHDSPGARLVPILLPPGFPDLYARCVRAAFTGFSSRADRPPHADGPWPLPWIAALVVSADRQSSTADYRLKRNQSSRKRTDPVYSNQSPEKQART